MEQLQDMVITKLDEGRFAVLVVRMPKDGDATIWDTLEERIVAQVMYQAMKEGRVTDPGSHMVVLQCDDLGEFWSVYKMVAARISSFCTHG